ncbi:MAG: hypothetical protein K2H47_00650 [Muribaculaceae bacterium]|nr:hypothetical protein [Muribaculaceae bacterium]
MRKLILTGLLIAGMTVSVEVSAKTPAQCDSVDKSSTVLEMIKSLPIETLSTGTLIFITPPVTPLSVTTDMGDVPVQNMQAFAKNPELFKNAFMSNFNAMGKDIIRLAEAAYNAGISLSIHLVSTSFPEGFVITFSVDELEIGLAQIKSVTEEI